MKYDLDYVFIDMKTTAIVETGAITEIAAIRTNRKAQVLKAWQSKVEYWGKGAPVPAQWEGAPPLKTALEYMKDAMTTGFEEKYIVVAHFSDFCRVNLREASRTLGIEEPFLGRAWLDTSQIAWPFIHAGILKGRSLTDLAKFFDVENPAPNTAVGDCETLLRVYWIMIRRMAGSIATGETAIRIAENSEVIKKGLRWLGI